ncbi:MAG: 50S ribosomal protein L21 [Candidatus Komeilibacteria bacterium CG_4_10_14_0_2_um_filter_37_10]|uniref:Large ribosomal subunit protein bL21 n=1 Tax=Candidatus Komeilibacteria bacterium CG_4_10_14_0_2_um_filter_37_10 TaxID=1974470 RepID=A0A2M7VG02_9BACT|nr:MAG: 50S ribosomal protein L21 [Candidatus Komeilibacteria bacterium CG_4_10_14_0_2_um_filter_37_10]PJA92738.1 MAG: 50S ribosomal protein L21 [Candidatus Komeilibacteria bacterium CG_4_9_14_3_um_filter_37_5]
MSIAIIKTGGKQYIVSPDQKIKIEKIIDAIGDDCEFSEVLLWAEEDGTKVEIGQPTLKKTIKGKVLKQAKSKKVTVIKYKNKTRYMRKRGHRQHYSEIQVS